LAGYSYDAAGNVVSIPGFTNYTYDAENHLVNSGGVSYSYDGDGRRVAKSNGTIYWYGASDDPTVVTDSHGPFEFLSFAGRRWAYFITTPSTYGYGWHFYYYDNLGNVRRSTYGYGGTWESHDFYPFGGEIASAHGPSNNYERYEFTGKERDSESGLDNFGARYDSSSMGRFMSPDWSETPQAVPYADAEDPQSLNLYSYTRNNPTNMLDDDGHDPTNPAGTCGFICRLVNWVFGTGEASNSASAENIQSLHWGTYSPNIDTAQNRGPVNARIPGTNLTNGEFIRGNDELTMKEVETLFSIEEFLDPTGMYVTAVGRAGGMRTNGDVILSMGFAHLFPAAGTLTRSQSARARFLKNLAADIKTPSWMKQWLKQGLVPPGYNVDHIVPLSIGGADTPGNMRLVLKADHVLWHSFYHPWR